MRNKRHLLVKICGITSEEDGRVALDAGADLVGVILARSPRRVTAERAAELVRALREHPRGSEATMTGVFMDAPLGWLLEVCRGAGFDLVQLHGAETPEYVGKVVSAGFRVMKVIRKLGRPAVAALERYPEAWAFLLEPEAEDAWAADQADPVFREARLALEAHPRVGLARRLSPENIRKVVLACGPNLWLVDAASSLERFPGVKDHDRVRAFVDAVRG
jgi:phosphoribosylanthranilate isomerase